MTDPLGVDRVLSELARARAAKSPANALSCYLGSTLARARLAGRLATRWISRGTESDFPHFEDGPLGLARYVLQKCLDSDEHAASIDAGEGQAIELDDESGPLVPESLPLAERLLLSPNPRATVEHEVCSEVTRGMREAAQAENRRVSSAQFAARKRGSPPITVPGWRIGFEYRTRRDNRVRRGRPEDHGENHKALDRIRAPHDDPIWDRFSPPLGFNAVEIGAMILTSEGEKRIEMVKPGDSVMTFQGDYARVYGVDAKAERVRMVALTLEDGRVLSLSSDHPVLTRRGWVAAGRLRGDDELAVIGCEHCGKPVPTWKKRFCDKACANRAKNVAKQASNDEDLRRTCAVCLKPFRAASRARANFCSSPCKHESERVHRSCRHCGLEVALKGKKKPHVFCGKKCAGLFNRKPDRPCDTCGASIRQAVKKSGQTFGSKRRFCSFRCWRRFHGETSIEKSVREYLQANQVAFVAQEQIGRYEVDFVLPAFMVAVECDGTYWHSTEKVKARDARKDKLLSGIGYVVVRLTEKEIKSDDGWKERLHAVCKDRVDQARGAISQSG